ncbi:hypothetical protein JTB14_017327 [Gonioctena quinquepunctata]|nr:hypothetical protein JTB14_017327 [Gonioctena quinquepunctata]
MKNGLQNGKQFFNWKKLLLTVLSMGKNKLKQDAVPTQLPGLDGTSVFLESIEEPEPVASTSQKHINKEFEASQTAGILSCGTPRKVQLRKTIKSLKRKLSTSQESQLESTSTHIAITVENISKFLEDHVSKNLANFLRTQLTLCNSIGSNDAYISFQKLPSAASKTVEFIEKMDNLFDIFNSSKFNKAKFFCRPFMGTESQVKFLKDMLEFFESLVIMNKNITKRMKFNFGWRLSISALLGMWDILKEKDIHKIHTRRLNQDCLENFFAKIRQQSGNCRNPTPIQFQRAFKKIFGLSYLDNSEGTNCLDEFDKILSSITPEVIQSCQILVSQPSYMKSLKIDAKDYTNLNITTKNGFVYVGGYFMKKVLDRHNCIACSQFAKEHIELDESSIYSFFRAYPNSKNDTFGNLKMPHISFLEYIHALENCFCELFSSLSIKENIGQNLKDSLLKISFITPCPDFPTDYIVTLFVRVRIYYTLKFMNLDIKSSSKKKEPNAKLKILKAYVE